ncbi:MAG: response regulator [Rhodospirillaceae bacterium]|jgi:putative two-component system response regulator|nr:response regulator [Rhodospirillaceae bacterium]MBT4938212.1 response regulator [Rhodospirillaceae bacterium]
MQMPETIDQNHDAKILIVDDKIENVQLLEMMLTYAGYKNVTSTTDSRDVEQLHQDNNFDIILLDIRMPHLDGYQVMGKLSSQVKDDYLPVLVLTAQKDMETKLKALEAGAKDFVTKPFDKTEVLNRIANMLEVRTLYNERRQQNEILEAKVQERTLELQERNKELEETRLEIIRRLGRAGEYRDNETGMHVIRMSKSCQRLALAAGLGEEHAERILQASPMHDVGKIGIPDGILLKPGKLDPEEWEIMKTHAEIGADIMGDFDSPLMRMAGMIAFTHHEKYDGSGYPNGIKGNGIPIEGRIAAICDVFDALTSERPYKEAWSVERAVDLINEESGKHFDPELVRLFNEILPDVLTIREQYADEE